MSGKNVIILVHGVGRHDPGWSLDQTDSPIPVLESMADLYSEFNDNPLSASIEFVEVTYDRTFETVRNQWKALAEGLADKNFEGVSQSSIDLVAEWIGNDADKLADALEPDTFAVTHALDAVMYKKLDLVSNIVRHDVAAQLARIVAERFTGIREEDPRFTIVAHSLGTAVVFDALQLLAGTKWLAGANALSGVRSEEGNEASPPLLNGGRFDEDRLEKGRSLYGSNPFRGDSFFDWNALFMISNVSAFMSASRPGPESESTPVRPARSGGLRGRCLRHYVNIDHVADPVAKLRRFTPDLNWQPARIDGTYQELVELKHFYDKNVHGLGHYLLNPMVHARIMFLAAPRRFSQGFRFVREADRAVLSGEFSNFGHALVDDALRARLQRKLMAVMGLDRSGMKDVDAHAARILKLAEALR